MKLETFFEKFDQFAEPPDAVAKMRELICQLAVQGRLVPQDQTEEPATILLEKINKARATLSPNRRGQDETRTTGLDGESTPYSAPPGWVWTPLGDVQVFTNGYAFKSEDYQPSGVGIIRMGELGANGEIDETGMKYVSDEIAQSLPDTFRVRPGDLLMGMSGSIGKLAINRSNKTYLLNQRVGRLVPILIEKAFLHVFLKTVEQHYLRISFGMAIKNLSTKQINETPFPLPPLAEQKRIVAKVDELMALCDRLEAQRQEREGRHAALARASLARFADAPTPVNLNFLFHTSYTIRPADLRKSILALAIQGKLVPQDANDEPAHHLINRAQEERKQLIEAGVIKKVRPLEENGTTEEFLALPENWALSSLDDIALKITDGEHATPTREDQGYYLLSARNVRDGFIDVSDVDYVGKDEFERIRKRCDPNKGDILLSCSGSVGRVAVVDADCKYAMVRSAALIKHSQRNVDSHYLSLALRSPCLQRQIERSSKQSAQANLFIEPIRRLIVPLPPLAEQRRIVARVDQLMALVDELDAQLAASRVTAEKLMEAIVIQLTAQE
jgi:type I restriction enzyme S subunit